MYQARATIATLNSLVFLLSVALLRSSAATESPRGSETPNNPTQVERAEDSHPLTHRHRLEFCFGYWDSGRRQSIISGTTATVESSVENLVGAFSYSYWMNDKLATFVTLRGLVAEVSSVTQASRIHDRTVVVSSILSGIRFYPFSTPPMAIRPYLATAVGPSLGVESSQEVASSVVTETTTTKGSFGGYLGSGLDLQMGRHLMAGIHAGYNFMADFGGSLAGNKNYSGLELGGGISLLLGSGR